MAFKCVSDYICLIIQRDECIQSPDFILKNTVHHSELIWDLKEARRMDNQYLLSIYLTPGPMPGPLQTFSIWFSQNCPWVTASYPPCLAPFCSCKLASQK